MPYISGYKSLPYNVFAIIRFYLLLPQAWWDWWQPLPQPGVHSQLPLEGYIYIVLLFDIIMDWIGWVKYSQSSTSSEWSQQLDAPSFNRSILSSDNLRIFFPLRIFLPYKQHQLSFALFHLVVKSNCFSSLNEANANYIDKFRFFSFTQSIKYSILFICWQF